MLLFGKVLLTAFIRRDVDVTVAECKDLPLYNTIKILLEVGAKVADRQLSHAYTVSDQPPEPRSAARMASNHSRVGMAGSITSHAV